MKYLDILVKLQLIDEYMLYTLQDSMVEKHYINYHQHTLLLIF